MTNVGSVAAHRTKVTTLSGTEITGTMYNWIAVADPYWGKSRPMPTLNFQNQ